MTVALAEHMPPPTAASPLVTTEPLPCEVNNGQFELAIHIAMFLSRPIEYIDDAFCKLAPFEPAQVRAIASHPAFCRPINQAVANAVGFAKFKIDGNLVSRLSSSPSSQLAAVIATAPMAEVSQVAWLIAAVVLSKRVRALVLKADRDRARDTLGSDGFDIATHEAPVLHPALCELDVNFGEPLFAQSSDDNARQGHVSEFGFQILGRFLDASEPALADMFALRLPSTVDYGRRSQVVRTFDKIKRDQFLKLIRRRQKSWAAIID